VILRRLLEIEEKRKLALTPFPTIKEKNAEKDKKDKKRVDEGASIKWDRISSTKKKEQNKSELKKTLSKIKLKITSELGPIKRLVRRRGQEKAKPITWESEE